MWLKLSMWNCIELYILPLESWSSRQEFDRDQKVDVKSFVSMIARDCYISEFLEDFISKYCKQ